MPETLQGGPGRHGGGGTNQGHQGGAGGASAARLHDNAGAGALCLVFLTLWGAEATKGGASAARLHGHAGAGALCSNSLGKLGVIAEKSGANTARHIDDAGQAYGTPAECCAAQLVRYTCHCPTSSCRTPAERSTAQGTCMLRTRWGRYRWAAPSAAFCCSYNGHGAASTLRCLCRPDLLLKTLASLV